MKKVLIGVLIVILVIGAGYYFNGHPIRVYPKFDPAKYIAGVDYQGITREDFNKRVDTTKNFFEWSNQNLKELPSLSKDVLDKMINESLVAQYAKDHKIKVDDVEVEGRYEGVIKTYNRQKKIKGESDTEFLAAIKSMYGTEKSDYMAQLREEILEQKVQLAVKMPLAKWLEKAKKEGHITSYL